MKPSIESKLRTIIREEIEYAFSKLTKRLEESAPKKKIIQTQKQIISNAPQREQLRKKFGGLLDTISEGMDLSQEENFSGITPEHIQGNTKLDAVHKAMTRDYSELIKRMENK
jgi:hypothetical protein